MPNESQEREQGKEGGDQGGRGESSGQGRGERNGQGRGGRAGRGIVPKAMVVNPEPIAGPSSRSYEEAHLLLGKPAKKTKWRVANLPPSVIEELERKKRSKELDRFLLPDAPPRNKRSRKVSPVRSACRLTEGTPTTPPPRIPQAWKTQQQEIDKKVCKQETPLATPPPARIMDVNSSREAVLPVGERTDSVSSSVCYDSVAEVPGFSPLRVDRKKGALKRKTTYTKNLAPTITSTPQVRGSDLQTGKMGEIFKQMWETVESDDDDDDIDDVTQRAVEGIHFDAAIDLATAQPALPDLHTEQVEWLEREDIDSDRHLRALLPTDDLVHYLTFDWSHDLDTFTGRRHEFTGTSGPTFEVNDMTRPIDVFMKFFDNNFLDMIVHQTNQNATYFINRDMTEYSRLKRWIDTDRHEMVIFFSILILQGLAPLTVEKNYWEENGYLTMPRLKTLMTFDRFVLLKRLLHFTEDTTSTDKLRKIKPVLNHLNEKFSTLYFPGRDIAIDESLLKWHGRLSFAQKIATKAAKVGVKSYELCESTTGYLWKFFIYTGKGQSNHTDETDQTEETEKTDETGRIAPPPPTNATARIVHNLVKPLLNRGHTLTMDNFYNSPLLARYLKSNGTDCFGTIRVNREFMPESIKSVTKGELRVGEIVQSFCRDLYVMVWRDSNMVSLISTFHQGEVGGKEKYGKYKFKPQVVLDYNLSMGGVDKKHQLLSAHPMERTRNQMWYKKVFRRLLNVTILNSYIIFKTHFKNIDQRAFRARLADEMIQLHKRQDIESPIPIVTSSLICDLPRCKRPILQGNHFIGTGQTNRARCVWCKRSRSKYICKQCGVALCLEICFEEFHTVKDRPTASTSHLQ